MTKVNCWELKKCGRETGGANADELGVCTAATETRTDGLNSGKNAGRICWSIAGTLCGGKVQGTFASKLLNCLECDVYRIVNDEETAKINCWEFKKCGREPGGAKVDELGECSAATETRTDGLNGGKKGGRICWAVTGTLCGGKVQGTFASKLANCMECDFYRFVNNEEGDDLKMYYSVTKASAY